MLATMLMTAVVTQTQEPDPSQWWLTPLMLILGGLFGGGGIAAIMKARYDKQAGVASQEVLEDDAISARWEKIIEAQTASLVEPLRTRLKEVEDSVKKLESELSSVRSRYWKAVAYIRSLLAWIRSHMRHVEQQPPPPPVEIIEDI